MTVGGVIGISERTFKIGEVYTGTEKSGDLITIRIAENSELNNDCPNSWCYQELLDVPSEYLKMAEWKIKNYTQQGINFIASF